MINNLVIAILLSDLTRGDVTPHYRLHYTVGGGVTAICITYIANVYVCIMCIPYITAYVYIIVLILYIHYHYSMYICICICIYIYIYIYIYIVYIRRRYCK